MEGRVGQEEAEEHGAFTGASQFFDWQCYSWDEEDASGQTFPSSPLHQSLVGSAEFQTLQNVIADRVQDYLAQLGKEHVLDDEAPDLFTWASVQHTGSSHLSHVHPGSLVSGVYYSAVPKVGAGKLLLDDPRGPLPPFNHRITLDAHRGKLILFPSWLSHQVTPTLALADEPRVSWSFNVLNGDWAHTTDITVSMGE
jgi:hypothetical protein